METRHEMMLAAYGIYLDKEKDLEFSTIQSYKNKAKKYYTEDFIDERPTYLEEAEQKIGFTD